MLEHLDSIGCGVFTCSTPTPAGFDMAKAGMGYVVTYKQPGTYRYKCEVSDNHGLRNTGVTTVVVRNGRLFSVYMYRICHFICPHGIKYCRFPA